MGGDGRRMSRRDWRKEKRRDNTNILINIILFSNFFLTGDSDRIVCVSRSIADTWVS